MPHRRRTQKGSFGGHFDELVTHFPHEEAGRRNKSGKQDKPAKVDSDVHDRLFESAWSKAREEQRRVRH